MTNGKSVMGNIYGGLGNGQLGVLWAARTVDEYLLVWNHSLMSGHNLLQLAS